jgi:(p)ppGpp synthase/HD superfamily hydrolase
MEPASLLQPLVFAADKHRHQKVAAVLGDTVEDTKTNYAELEIAFVRVAGLVKAVTEDECLLIRAALAPFALGIAIPAAGLPASSPVN